MAFKTIAIDHSATSPERARPNSTADPQFSIAIFSEEKHQPNPECEDGDQPPEVAQFPGRQFDESQDPGENQAEPDQYSRAEDQRESSPGSIAHFFAAGAKAGVPRGRIKLVPEFSPPLITSGALPSHFSTI